MKKRLCVLLIAACAPGGNATADKRADASPNG